MAAKLRIDGLAELKAALAALPPALVHEASAIVLAAAAGAAAEIAAAYPHTGTGALARSVGIETRSDAFSATAIVRNRARHAYIFERGTDERRWKNGKETGRMPKGDVFVPIAIERRERMTPAFVALLERNGLHVTVF